VDLAPLLALRRPVVRARYELQDAGQPTLADFVDRWLAGLGLPPRGTTTEGR
jgi:hypothetical protein